MNDCWAIRRKTVRLESQLETTAGCKSRYAQKFAYLVIENTDTALNVARRMSEH